MQKPKISMVVALGYGSLHSRVIGKNNALLWHIPEDLKRFKQLTVGHPVIMGRKTFESILSILGKPLPNRVSIVITRDTTWTHEGAIVTHSLPDAIKKASELDVHEIFIGGGSEIYAQALPLTDRLYLTLIHDDKEGDAYFPPFEGEFTEKLSEESHIYDGLQYTWVTLERKK